MMGFNMFKTTSELRLLWPQQCVVFNMLRSEVFIVVHHGGHDVCKQLTSQ